MKIIEFDNEETTRRTEAIGVHDTPLRGAGWRESSAWSALADPVDAPVRRGGTANWRAGRVARASESLKMHVLDLGKLRLDKNFMVANSTVATARTPHPPGQVIDIPVSAYFIEHPDGNVLYDTGCHPDWGGPRGRWPQQTQEIFPVIGGEECLLPARLEAMGVGPDQIRHVVLSHLHCDHAGCVEFFRKSQLIVHEDEFLGAYKHFALRDDNSPYIVGDLERWSRLGLNWRLVSRTELDQTIVPGVRLLNFGSGHAYGMLGLDVDLRSRNGVMLVSDACYTAENYGPPMKHPGISFDSLGVARTIERIRAIANDKGSDVWFGHDAEQFASVRKFTEGYYE
jgi:glyoxylase-like metal-dependent hydrolase (beta-lactamase superfamily II)